MIKLIAVLLLATFVLSAEAATFVCDTPTVREDGAAMPASDIKGYDAKLTQDGVVIDEQFVTECQYTTPPGLPYGTYQLSMVTVDNWALRSPPSTISEDIIPTSTPSPPNNIRLRLDIMEDGTILITVPS